MDAQLLGNVISGGVSLIVGFGGAWLGNRHANKMAQLQRRDERYSALVSYEKALLDEAFYIESTLGPGSGAHASPEPKALETSRSRAYGYLKEFDGHKQDIALKSPYFEHYGGGDERSDEIDFYYNAAQAVKKHLRKYPTEPKRGPYDPSRRWVRIKNKLSRKSPKSPKPPKTPKTPKKGKK